MYATSVRAVPAVVRLLYSRRRRIRPLPTEGLMCHGRSLHTLGLHGGARGLAALRRAALQRNDPVIHQIDAALEEAATPPNKRLKPPGTSLDKVDTSD